MFSVEKLAGLLWPIHVVVVYVYRSTVRLLLEWVIVYRVFSFIRRRVSAAEEGGCINDRRKEPNAATDSVWASVKWPGQ